MSEYNGWTNYETWCVNLWLTNEERSQQQWHSIALGCYASAEAKPPFTREDKAAYDLADKLKTHHMEGMPELDGVFLDLLGAALGEVNWDEIARNLLSGIEVGS